MIYVFTGAGKGKTTAALGMIVRALGADKQVALIRFLKNEKSSELPVLQKLGVKISSFGRIGFFLPPEELDQKPQLKKKGVQPLTEKDQELAQKGLEEVEQIIRSGEYDLIVLDEINIALSFDLVKEKELFEIITSASRETDIVLTGRRCPKSVVEKADLVTEMKEVKHYYHQGQGPRRGIED